MARADIRTKLPLDTWARMVGLDPRHFNQVTTAAKAQTTCSRVWKQFAWQENGQVSREDVAQAIEQAEQLIESELHYNLIPDWTIDEPQVITKPGAPDVLSFNNLDARGFPLTTRLDKNYYISGGIKGKTLIEAGATVTYSDEDGDNYPETATIVVVTTVTDPQEIAVFFPGEDGADDWEIRPLNDPLNGRRSVTIAGGTATIVCAREQLVDPDLWQALSPGGVDGDEDSNFVATVDVYRVFNDPQQQATLVWNPNGFFCDCSGGICPTCVHSSQTACLVGRDFRNSIIAFTPATWNADDEAFDSQSLALARSPDNLRLWYFSGFRDRSRIAPNLEMHTPLARAVLYLSFQFLTNQLCGCNNVQHYIDYYVQDLALDFSTDVKSTSFQNADRVLGNPFGTTRGALFAWNTITRPDRQVGRAVRL